MRYLDSAVQIHIYYGTNDDCTSDKGMVKRGISFTPMEIFGVFSDLQVFIDLDDDVDQYVFTGNQFPKSAPLDRKNCIHISPF